MDLLTFIFVAAVAVISDGFTVRSPSDPLVAPLGSLVVLPCYVDKPLPMEGLEVEWRRTDSENLVHLYQDGKSRPEAQQQDYNDRAHFFTDQIQHGNFSLHLDNLRPEDEGQYICKVYTDQDSGETLLVIKVDNIEGLVVSGSDEPISASLGFSVSHIITLILCISASGSALLLCCLIYCRSTDKGFFLKNTCYNRFHLESSVVLPCQVVKHLLKKKLHQDGESRPEKQHKDYHDRAHFFTDQIQHGNFSLHLDNLRAEDEGQYTCAVYIVQDSVFSPETDLHLRLLDTDSVFRLQMFLVFCPNILMLLAFVFWGVSEGSLNESISCCALYFLRPLMLLWAAPYVNNFTGNVKTFIDYYSYDTEYIVFSAVFYSVLFKSASDNSLNYSGFESFMIIVLFVTMLLLNLIYIIILFVNVTGKASQRIIAIFDLLARLSFEVLPSLQFILLFFTFGSTRGEFFIIAVLPVFLTVTNYNWDKTCGERMGCSPRVRRFVWMIVMLFINSVMVYFYFIAMENEKDRMGWICTIVFLQLLWALMNFTGSFKWDLHRVVPVYLFGSVAAVLLNSVSLMTELILKTVNGYGAVGDLRIVVFSSESTFILFLMILMVFEPWIKPCLQSCQNTVGSDKNSSQ